MLSLGKFPIKLRHNTVYHNPMSQNLHIPSKSHVSFSTDRPNLFDLAAFPGKKLSGFHLNALKTEKDRGFTVPEMEGIGNFEDGFDDEEFVDVEDDDVFDEEDDVIVPLQNMKKWLENKPRGFGEGKVYDTLIEDGLMEEIEQSRKAQLANVNKLKNSSMKTNSKKEITSDTPNGFRVRVVNLPKKKNIHKDLRLAFEGVPGILDIVPVVSGNEKTRDPVCKGLGFIDFKYKDGAERFVEEFSGKSLMFGKVQKQIKCELLDSKSQKPESNQSLNKAIRPPQQAALSSGNVSHTIVETNILFSNSREEDILSEDDDANENYVIAQWEEGEELESNFSEEQEMRQESSVKSSSSKQGRKVRQNDKRGAPNMKKDKISKLKSLGAAKRLKIREKSLLTGVFSKYGAKTSSTVEEQSR